MTQAFSSLLFKWTLALLLAPLFVFAQTKTGEYGGTFDPPHEGHRQLLERVLEQLPLAEILVIPNPDPKNKPGATAFAERLAMAKLAFADMPRVRVVTAEEAEDIGRESLMRHFWKLYRKNRQDQIFQIVGDDVLEKIAKNSTLEFPPNLNLVVSLRGQDGTRSSEVQIKNVPVISLYGQDLGLSSSQIRQSLASGLNADSALRPEVRDYIFQRGLYGTKNRCQYLFGF